MDVKSLEHPTLKVPYEILNKKFRSSQKVVDREVNHVSSALTDLEKLYTQDKTDRKEIIEQLDKVKKQLEELKDKGNEGIADVLEISRVCKRRVDHLKEGCSDDMSVPQQKQWKKNRLDRVLVEHFLRSGFYQTAIQLSKTSGIEDMTNVDVFLAAKDVEESLLLGDISKCLVWCHENKSKLRKMKSTLEFNVRIQEFIEYIKNGKKIEAVKYARKFLSSDEAAQLDLVQQVMGLLAFPLDTPIQPYKDLLAPTRWQDLFLQFRNENYKLHQLSSQSMLSVTLQAGLACLKTPHCYRQGQSLLSGLPGYIQDMKGGNEERNLECPVCHPPLNTLANALPYSHCSQSRLVCHISGSPLNENNCPMMLPNGHVYGEQALIKMANENDGQIICPRTKEIYPILELEKVFVM